MAECTQYTSIIISGAGIVGVNGTYLPYSTGTRGDPPNAFTIFTKDGGDTYPRITVAGSDPGFWSILGNAPFPSAPVYTSLQGSFTANDCPVGVNWSVGPFGSSPAPTSTGAGGSSCIFTLKEGETCTRRTQVLYYLGYI